MRTAIGLAIVTTMLAAPAAAGAQATLTVDPVEPCYREQDQVLLLGSGFTANGDVVFSRDGEAIGDPIAADPGGELQPRLRLPGLVSGQQRLTYVATDATNVDLKAQVTMLVTATDVTLRPEGGPPHRRLTINARGFLGGSTLYAHIVRKDKRAGRVRNTRIGRLTGPCKRVQAQRRLFSRRTAAGRYRVQFDTYRRYRRARTVKTDFVVTVYRNRGRAAGLSPAS